MAVTETKIDPLKQALICFTAALLFMVLGWLFTYTGLYTVERLFAWSIALTFMLLYAVFSSLLSLQFDNVMQYWGRSVYSYMGLAVANGLLAWLFSGVPIGEAESYKWIYFVVTFGFLVFLSMVSFIRRIINFAEREEWNQPRMRPPKKH
jgi:hypothetical protein